MRGTEDVARRGERVGLQHAREAEVDQLDRPIRLDVDVARLDIAVHNVEAVGMVQRLEHLLQDPDLGFE